MAVKVRRVNLQLRKVKINELLFGCAFALFLVLYIFNGYEFGAILESIFIPACLLLCCSLFLPRKREIKRYAQAISVVLFAALSTYLSNIINITQSRILHVAFCCLMFAIIPGVRLSDATMKHIISFYIKFTFVLCSFVLAGWILGFGVDSYGRASIYMGSFYKDQNYLSAYFMPSFAINLYGLIFSKERRISKIVNVSIIMIAVFIMGSRGSLVTILMIVALSIARMVLRSRSFVRNTLILLLLSTLAFCFLIVFQTNPLFERMFGFSDYNSDVRLRLWLAGLKGFSDSPIIGSGIGSASALAWSLVGNAVHNSFVEILADQGIVGAFLCLWMLIDMLRTRKDSVGFVATLLLAFFLPLFFLTGYSNLTFWMPMFFLKLISNVLKSNETLVIW